MTTGLSLSVLTNDIEMVDGELSLLSGNAKIAQDIKTRLKTIVGEFVLDSSYGFPYSVIFNSRALDLSEIETTIKNYIRDTPNVIRIVRFSLSYEKGSKRNFIVSFSVETVESVILNSEVSLNVGIG